MSTLFGYEVVEQAQEIDRLSTEIASLTAENKRLREALAIAATWTAEPGVTLAEIHAALNPKPEETA